MSETIDPGSPTAAPADPVSPTGEGFPPAPADTTAAAATADVHAEDAGAEPEAEKHRGGFQKRISELTANWRAEQRRTEELTRILEQVAGQRQQPQEPAKPAAPQLPPDLAQAVGPAPNPTDFPAGEFDPAYIEERALHRFRTEQARQVMHARQTQQRQQQAEFGKRVASVMEATVAADPAVAEALQDPSFPMPAHVVRELVDCDAPEKVLAHLGRNPQDAARIAGLRTPQAVARELARIEAKLTSAPPPPQPTAAPPPPRPVRGAASTHIDPSRMSMEEYARWRNGG